MTDPTSTFTRQETIDKPGIIGARWWHQSIATQVPRRQAMTGLLALGGVLAAMAAIGTCAAVAVSGSPSTPTDPEVSFQPRGALDMQKEYGWNFGATGDKLTFNGEVTQAFDRTTLGRMTDELAPSEARHAPFFVSTLFQSPTALPKSTAPGDPAATPFVPLKDALVPVFTAAMDMAFSQGKALASLLEKDARTKDLAVIVDLPGPEAVAFAAGASNVLDPVFLFDNWPHPRGVVPAQLTLGAAAYYQPLFARARGARPKGARPMFVLDRQRLASYTDDASQFDNRHTARMPSTANLANLGTKNILYVSPNAVARQESDDLADDFLAYASAKMPIRIVPATAFEEDPSAIATPSLDGGTTSGTYFYGGSRTRHPTFWTHWSTPASGLATNDVQTYTPTPRTTPFSTGTPTAAAGTRPRPTGFGTVPVAIAVGTGLILGAKLSRSGSWNRTTSSSSGS